ncbi:MAG: autotransporter assembly complex family protein [Pseudomonadota bacterium]|nr:autotransporter assembly complex family protein [Pseudomonadota bacterium]
MTGYRDNWIAFGRWLILLTILSSASAWAQQVTVSIEGLPRDLQTNAEASVTLARMADRELTPAQIRRLHTDALEEIRRALEPFGYYQTDIHSSLKQTAEVWTARYVVDAGPPVRITDIDIQILGPGEEDPAIQRVARSFPLKVGDVALHRRYEDGKRRMMRVANERGYIEARMATKRLEVRPDTLAARVVLRMETGIRYCFGEVTLQQDVINPDFLARFVPFETGEPYSADRLLQLQYRLLDAEYFSTVDVVPRRDLAKDCQIPIEVELAPAKRNRYTLGLGYGTDTGARALIGYTNRRVNRRGHRINVDARLAETGNGVDARYVIPIDQPATDNLALLGRVFDEDIDDRFSRIRSLGVARNNVFGRWTRTLRLMLENETFDIGLGADPQRSDALIPGLSFSYVSVNDPLATDRGYRWSVDLQGAHEAAASDITFAQVLTNVRTVYRVWPRGRFLARSDLGYTSVNGFDDLALSKRFYAGGDYSVRGYDYKSLGAIDEGGRNIGGRYLFTLGVDYEHRVYKDWSVAVFYDAGSAFNDTEPDLKQGAGVGLRWQTPVGPLRIDVAHPFDDPDTDYRLHLTFGPDL